MIGLYQNIATRLTDRCPAILQAVAGVSAREVVEALTIGPDVTAIVAPIGDRAEPVYSGSLKVTQVETWRVGVTLVLTFPGGFSEYESARDQMKACLRGWSPEGSSMPLQYAGSQLLQYSASEDGGRWMTLFEFTVTTQATYEHQP